MATADPGAGSFTPINMFAMLRAMINNGVPHLTISGPPVNGASGSFNGQAGPGALLTDYTNGVIYLNVGTLASPTWQSFYSVTGVQQASGTITSANITGTAAGQLGHANGVILVPAPGTHFTNILLSAVAHFKFITAAYTGGGNITVNQGAGGAALTGLVSAANSTNSATSKSWTFYPLSTAAVANVENGPLNLVAAAAPTQPGTAAGTILWVVNFITVPTNF